MITFRNPKVAVDSQVRVLGYEQSVSSDKVHEIRLGKDGRVYCTCAAWKFSRGPIKMCKHIRKFMKKRPEWIEACTNQSIWKTNRKNDVNVHTDVA